MANRNQQRGGQYSQGQNRYPTNNQAGDWGQGNRGQQSAYQGNSNGQFGGDYGHDTNYQGTQQYGNYETQGDFRGYADHSNSRFGNDDHGSGENYSGQSRSHYETNANDQWEPQNSRGPRGYGHSHNYGGALGYQDETLRTPQGGSQRYDRSQPYGNQGSYNQGGQEGYSGSGGQHHDPDYQQWRNEQIRALDNDYKAWRDERYSTFSNEFGEWRKGRKDKQQQSASGSTHSGSRADSDASSPTGSASQGSVSSTPKSK